MKSNPAKKTSPPAEQLLSWYQQHQRLMPWRYNDYKSCDPYKIWISEIMLQQTTVQTVTGYFQRFIARFPDVKTLALSPRDDVLSHWSGLGYYHRARNLHEAAKQLYHLGYFPSDVDHLLQLPGIGPYTARAIASIAFNKGVVPVDGNVERIVARIFTVCEPLPQSRKQLEKLSQSLNQEQCARDHASQFTQALFDLGATICKPRNPQCHQCPWQDHCGAYQRGNPEQFPKKTPKKSKHVRYRLSYLVMDVKGHILLMRRDDTKLLGGTYDLPSVEVNLSETKSKKIIQEKAPCAGQFMLSGKVKHVFTHFTLYAHVYRCQLHHRFSTSLRQSYKIVDNLSDVPLSTLTRKCITVGQEAFNV